MEDEIDTGSVNDLDDYSYSEDSQSNHQLSMDRLPLVPTDFTSVQEALQNFTAVFESRWISVIQTFIFEIQIRRS